MAVSYIVQQGPSATGPWTAVPGSPFSSAACSIAETAGNYYIQITAQDLVLGISSTPAVFGPYTIAINNPNAPNVANAVFFDDFTSENIAWTAWNPNGGTGTMATPGNGSVVLGSNTWTVTAGGLPFLNGSQASTGSQVLGLWNVGGTIWIDCITDRWFSWNGSTWVSGSAPVGRAWLDHYPFGGDEYNLPAVDEQEYMCSSQAGYTSSTAFNPFSVSNSILSIKAQSVSSSGDSNPGSQPWNGGNISSCTEVNAEPTSGLFSFTYGYTEIRCQTPAGGPTNLNGPGFWPQMVLYPLSGVGPAEIDIFEILGGSPTVVRQTVHFSGGVGQTQFSPTAAINTGFHRVGVDWQPSTITFYIDGVQTGQIATPATQFNAPFYINCGLAVAGSTSWGGGTPVNTQLVDPGVFQIDYIGVWPSFALAYPSTESPAGTTVTTVGPEHQRVADAWLCRQRQHPYHHIRRTNSAQRNDAWRRQCHGALLHRSIGRREWRNVSYCLPGEQCRQLVRAYSSERHRNANRRQPHSGRSCHRHQHDRLADHEHAIFRERHAIRL